MTISPKTKKIAFTFCSAALIAGGVFVLFASPAKAVSFLDVMKNPSQLFYMMLGSLANLLFSIGAWFVQVAATLLEFTFSIEKFTDVAVVKAGWKVTRDLCNIGFVLVLLIMAFDSILQTGNYQIKAILPRLVVAALLINFSLVFCGMIIDFSQIMTHFFYEAAKGGNTAGLSGQIAGALNIQSVFQEPGDDWGAKLKAGDFTSMIIGIFFGTAILMIAAFSIAAAAIFFIVRIVSLWLLMIFAPIAWLAMIVPGAPEIGGYWNKWWGEFLKWSFFAPVYMFFIYLAIMIASTAPISTMSTSALAQDSLLKTNAMSGFFKNGIYAILQYIAIIMILLSGLKYATKSGIAGAGAVMSVGKTITNKAKDYSKKAAKSPFSYAYDRAAAPAMARVGTLLKKSNFSPIKKLGYRAETKAGQMQDKVNAERGESLKGISDEGQMYMAQHSWGPNKVAALESLNKSGALTKDYIDPVKQAQARILAEQAINSYRSVGREKEVKELEELKPDAITDATKRNEAVSRAVTNGNWKKWNASVMEGPNGKDIMGALQEKIENKELSQADFNDTFKGWSKRMKETAEKQMKANFTDDFNPAISVGKQNIARREMFASTTGKLDAAFTSSAGTLHSAVAQPYISKMSAPQVSSINDNANLQLIGQHATTGQLDSIVRSLNGHQKTQVKAGAIASGNMAIVTHVTSSPGWVNV